MLAVTARSLEATQDLHDDHQREAVSAAIGRPRYAEFAAVIEQAIDRGEVSADCDVALPPGRTDGRRLRRLDHRRRARPPPDSARAPRVLTARPQVHKGMPGSLVPL